MPPRDRRERDPDRLRRRARAQAAPARPRAGRAVLSAGWETRSTREVYANAWIRVREDDVVRPDGRRAPYGVVEVRQPAVFVVALTEEDEVVLVTLDRYTLGRASVEVPAGGSDGEDLESAARRELLEETGYVAQRLAHLGVQYALNGVAHAEAQIFLARGATRPPTDEHAVGQLAEGITHVAAYPWPDVRRMLRDGSISDSESAGALLLAALELGWA